MNTDIGEGPSQLSNSPPRTINAGDTVLIKIPSGDVRTIKLEKEGTVNLGKFGSFYSNELVGQQFGLSYEIRDKKLKVLPPRTFQEVEDTGATNELIDDGQAVQPLTLAEIEALKKSGVSAEEIINKQIEMHANFSKKNEYSKEKYKKRKEAKYSKSFSTVIPTLYNVCDYWFKKDQNRLRDIRPDSLSQMLSMANIRPGGRYLAVDDASGIVVAGIMERLGGNGRLITICDVDSPPAYPVLTQMNFPKSFTSIMSHLNWSTADEEHMPIIASSEPPSGTFKSDGQRARLNKRKAVTGQLMQVREELFAGEFDGLIVASQYDPYSILEKLLPYLGGSASIVVHSPFVQIVADLQGKLRDLPQYLAPAVTEAWTRCYQILPGRTHPLMNASGSGGFILHTIKVYDDPTASSVKSHRVAKKARTDQSASVSRNASAAPEQSQPQPEKPQTEQSSSSSTTQPSHPSQQTPPVEPTPSESTAMNVDADSAS
ncbi:Gcd10p-domain-containing protein [Panus rudis PR-1116 ss-1]|nr:Gcd10p-domain-containing protein [Panus rudis PR-1116 ss-1]